jgi:hypothetical protein
VGSSPRLHIIISLRESGDRLYLCPKASTVRFGPKTILDRLQSPQ